MGSIKLKLKKERPLEDKSCPILIQIIYNRKKSIYTIPHSCKESDWNDGDNLPKAKRLRLYCQKRILEAEEYLIDAEDFGYSAKYISDLLSGKKKSQYTLVEFGTMLGDEKIDAGSIKTGSNYKTSINNFSKYLKGREILLSNLTYDLLADYKRNQKHAPSTFNTQLGVLRTIYNEAIDREVFIPKKASPFKSKLFKRGIKSKKRNISEDDIKLLEKYRLENDTFKKSKYYPLALDLFLLSYYFRGMSTIDLLKLKNKDVKGEYICSSRSKLESRVDKELKIKIFPKAKEIVNRYLSEDEYLFPVKGNNKTKEGYTDKNKVSNGIWHILKGIGNELEISIPLTMYVSRHSFATIAKNKGVPFLFIQELLGHSLKSVTEIYIDQFPQEEVDKWHEKVIRR